MQAQSKSRGLASFILSFITTGRANLHARVALPSGINPVAHARTQRREAARLQSPHIEIKEKKSMAFEDTMM
jgi:hypothetical protein